MLCKNTIYSILLIGKKPSQRIWTGPNLDQVESHRKNLYRLYSTKNHPQGLSFRKVSNFILLMSIHSQRIQVRRFRIELSLAEGIISSFFLFGRKYQKGITIIKIKRSQRSETKGVLTGILSCDLIFFGLLV